jgi:hypothetical protein
MPSSPQNAPIEGNPVLSDRQLERLIRAVIVGYGRADLPQRQVDEAVNWAEGVMRDAGLLGQVFDGRVALRKFKGERQIRPTTTEEARYILEAEGKVEREG